MTSSDDIIQQLAWGELVEIANWRYQSTAKNNLENYLNSAPSDRTSDKFKSTWSRARQASKRLKINWNIPDLYKVDF